jgi:hypothetical protein
VPSSVTLAVSPVYQSEVMPTPGAKMSRLRPKFDHHGRVSEASVAPTVMASGTSAGES